MDLDRACDLANVQFKFAPKTPKESLTWNRSIDVSATSSAKSFIEISPQSSITAAAGLTVELRGRRQDGGGGVSLRTDSFAYCEINNEDSN